MFRNNILNLVINQQQIITRQYSFYLDNLFYAIEANDCKTVTYIIKNLINFINLNCIYKDCSFLSKAIFVKNQYIIELLLQCNADPNFIAIPQLECFPLNQVINNILDENNYKKHIDYQILQLLFKYKADPNLSTKYDPLVVAVTNKSCKLVSLLIENGARPYNGLVMCLSKSRSAKISFEERQTWLSMERLFSSKYNVLCSSMIHYFSNNLSQDKFISIKNEKYRKNKINKEINNNLNQQLDIIKLNILWDNYTANTRNEIINTISTHDEYNPEDILQFIDHDEGDNCYIEPHKIHSISSSSNKYYNKMQ